MELPHERYEAAGTEESKHEASHTGHHTSRGDPHTERSHTLRVVVVGTESAVFEANSPVRERILAYTKNFATTDIIVMCGGAFKREHPSEGVGLYPTNSRFRIMRIVDAITIGRSLERADVVSVQDPFETGLAALFIARALGARLHIQIHTDFLSPHFARLSLVNRCRVVLARFVLSHADRVRVVSEKIATSLTTNNYTLKTNPIVLPIFIDVAALRAASAPPTLVSRFASFKMRLLVVARLESEKNVALAIRAFAKGAPKDTCLIIVGDGRERMMLQNLSQNLGVMGRVFFEGKQNAAPYYALADLLLVTSRYEGYGRVIVEALAKGVPVLSTDVGIAREQGAIVAPPEAFAEALRKWCASGPRRAQLTSYPYEHFNEYVRAYCDDIAATTRVA